MRWQTAGARKGLRLLRKRLAWLGYPAMLLLLGCASLHSSHQNKAPRASALDIPLPPPCRDGSVSLEKALGLRRTERELGTGSVTLAEVSQLLWAAQGITASQGFRTAPSAGALYPLEIRVVAGGEVAGLPGGSYLYRPQDHRLQRKGMEDLRRPMIAAALDQAWVGEGAALFIITAVPERTTGKYGARGQRYVWLEAGHAAQNLLLQAAALGLRCSLVGAFDDGRVSALLGLESGEIPIYLIGVGKPVR